MANRKRNKAILLRMTQNEHEQFTEKAAKTEMTNTDFVLMLLTKKPIVIVEELRPILVELKRQGNNLNQMARMLNQGEISADLEKVLQNCYAAYRKLLSFEVK